MLKIRLNKLNLIAFSILLICCQYGNAQLVTSTAQTPQQLVQNVLIGTGVNVSNINYTGAPNAIGYFDGTNCNVGLNSGIILTTGTVLNSVNFGTQEGPFGPNDTSGAGVDNNEPGEPLLAAATGFTSHNAARLEFDFIPQSDSIKFNFVFGSEEYLEFVGGGVNDAFGFFISGPNPAGGNFANENIALIPGTNLPITINDLNATSNAAYYIDNGDGNSAPQNGSNNFIQYDGLTTQLTAKSSVVCGQSYHIIIVISDIGDGVVDSGVFIEAGSFTSPGIDISSELSFQGSVANDSTLIEGCGEAELWFVRNDSLAFNQTLPLTISGTATMGTDYTNIPNTIFFPAGEDSVSITLSAFNDNISEPLEYLQLLVDLPSPCTGGSADSIRIYIQNVDSLVLNLQDATVECPNTPVTISANVSHGNPGYNFLWNTGETTSTISVSPAVTTDYTVTVTDTCGQVTDGVLTVTVPVFNPINVQVSNDTIVNCPNVSVELSATSSGGGANHTIEWSNGQIGNNATVNIPSTITYYATVTDACGNNHQDSVLITLNEIPITTTISIDTAVCKGQSVELIVTPSGGVGTDYNFTWNTGQTDSIINVTPLQTTEYIVGISDECGYIKTWDTVTVSIIQVIADFVVTGTLGEGTAVQFNNISTGATTYEWDLGNGNTSNDEHTTETYDISQNYVITLVATNDAGCSDSTYQVIQVKPEFFFYAPNAFTPDGDEFNQTWMPVVRGIDEYDYDVYIFNRWGQLIWENHDPNIGWDGTYNGRKVEIGVYVWKAKIKLPGIDDRKTFNGMINLLK